ncbi:winged helix-turn-helix transcriptional regulator [Halorubrum xinjiangense]|uniref:winged helix-turn-helix transcriptional regulator n=1 Tax=Halorubrum xinjiangense TaxID=261291 RepID=UPI003C6F2569
MAGRDEVVDDSEIVDIFESATEPVLTTKEVANEIGFSLTGARKRLAKLESRGIIKKKKAGNSSIWWLEEDR